MTRRGHTRLGAAFNALRRFLGTGVRPLGQRATIDNHSKYHGNHLVWPITKSARTFRVFVVEPKEYSPAHHSKIFDAAITSLVTPMSTPIDPFSAAHMSTAVEHFDLITFPEAFLPQDDLLSALGAIMDLESIGCVHVGLRPTDAPDQHLFTVQEISTLVSSLSKLPEIERSDLDAFSNWLLKQAEGKKFNIGCLFTIDVHHKLRICLHPKLVRSKFEISRLQEQHMSEADLLSLVTLLPADKAFLSVTLQPLLCSDALHLETDRPHCWPIDAVNTDANSFEVAPPDHVDIVSVATCTPQLDRFTLKSARYRTWHQEYLNSFTRTANELLRHHYSIFVLSNFQTVPGPTPGGLSGAFVPAPLRGGGYPTFVTTTSWGRFKNLDNQWSTPDDDTSPGKDWSSLAHLACIDSVALEGLAPAFMLGFTVYRLLRDGTRWRPTEGLVDFQLRSAADVSGTMAFT